MFYLTIPLLAIGFWIVHLWRQVSSGGTARPSDGFLWLSGLCLAGGSVGLFYLGRAIYPVPPPGDVGYSPDKLWLVVAIGLSVLLAVVLTFCEVILRLVYLFRGRG